jgi:hypothetical protein
MKTKILILFCALLAIAAGTNVVVKQFEPLKAKLTVKALDESGQPFPNVDVQIGFENPMTRRNVNVEGKTDADGLFIAEGACDGSMGGSIQKNGYYRSGFPFKITGEKDGKWLPWNPICKTTLRPIGKPVALYAKTVQLEIPALNKPCGFDLIASDWVAPYGKGKEQDFVFMLNQDYRGIQNYDLKGELTFEQPTDGIQETFIPEIGKYSEFKWERLAPENGYQMKFALQNTWSPQGKLTKSFKSSDDWQGYFFRVRAVEQDGKIVRAQYGKMLRGIAVYPSRKSGNPKIVFTYYLNPTPNDRNLEWDTKKNLFSGLNNDETPHPSWWP